MFLSLLCTAVCFIVLTACTQTGSVPSASSLSLVAIVGKKTITGNRQQQASLVTGAGQPVLYVPSLQRKRVAMAVNQPSIIGKKTHLVFTLRYLLEFYQAFGQKGKFFTNFFTNLAGTDQLQKQILASRNEKSRVTWKAEVTA